MSKELREEFAAVRCEALKTITEAKKASRQLTSEEKTENEKRFARCKTIQEQLEQEKQFAGLKLNEIVAEQRHEAGKVTKESHKAALNHYLRTGEVQHMLATMIAGPVPGGSPTGTVGVALPAAEPVFIKRLRSPFRAIQQYFGLSPIQTDGYTNVPVIDTTGSTVDEIGQAYVGDNAKNDAVTNLLPANRVFDSGTRWISDLLVNAVPNILNAYVQPLRDTVELKTAASFVSTLTTGGSAATVGVTTSAISHVTYSELVAWKFSLPAEYQTDAAIVASNGFLADVYGLVDDNHRPLYVSSLSDDAPDRLFGVPIFLSSAMQAPGAGNVPAAILSASALIVTEQGPQQVVRYTGESQHPLQTGLRVLQVGGNGFIGAGVRLLKNAAS